MSNHTDHAEYITNQDLAVARSIAAEEQRQAEGLELIPSENYVSKAVREALGSVFTNKYSEGQVGKRYYGGQENTDTVEQLAIDRACQLFKAEHANVQPLSGAPANVAVYLGLLQPGDTILGMDLSHGGHLTHGHPVTAMAQLFDFKRYHTLPNGEINYAEMEQLALTYRPKLILAGFSAYPGSVQYAEVKRIADSVGALTMMDAAHIAGLIAGKALPNPFDYGFDIITTTTHKTLRGPRGGMILCKKNLAQKIDKAVFPGLQGGPHMNTIAALAVALGEAQRPRFEQYAQQILKNAQALAHALLKAGAHLIANGTQNHLLLIDVVKSYGKSGKVAQQILDSVLLTANMNMIPNDQRSPFNPSGIRLGTPALTTRGMKESEMQTIAQFIHRALTGNLSQSEQSQLREEVTTFARKFPIPERF